MWKYNHTDELMHHGVLGMRWGVRRKRKASGTATVKDKKTVSEQVSTTNKKGSSSESSTAVKPVSNAELRSMVERIELEKRYAALVSERKGKSAIAKGGKFVGNVLADASKKALTSYSQALITNGLQRIHSTRSS